jgi:hypothetical protein
LLFALSQALLKGNVLLTVVEAFPKNKKVFFGPGFAGHLSDIFMLFSSPFDGQECDFATTLGRTCCH